jgi:predicted nucleic acid-binding protein
MIYVDTSVVLAQLLDEKRVPPADLWSEPLIASRLLEYEVWTRLHTRRLARTHGDPARELLARVSLVEMRAEVLGRALEPFPVHVRTLDAIHLATMVYLRENDQELVIASFDGRLLAAARGLGFEVRALDRS